MISPSPLWYLDRSAGEVTLLLLSACVVLGIVRAAFPAFGPFVIERLHVNLALLVAAFGIVHVAAAILDPFVGLGLLDATVPFVSAYRELWLGLGVVSAYTYVAVVALSWPARRLPRKAWLWIHRAMYPAWAMALLHSLGTGSDARNQLFLFLDLFAVAAVIAAVLAVRVVEGFRRRPAWWSFLAALTLVATLAFGAWAASGPLQPGWARSAGTPANLLKSP